LQKQQRLDNEILVLDPPRLPSLTPDGELADQRREFPRRFIRTLGADANAESHPTRLSYYNKSLPSWPGVVVHLKS
jgi:hypothetical protein